MSNKDAESKRSPTPHTHIEHQHALQDTEALARAYGPTGLKGLLQSGFVLRCACFAAFGGLLFGYDQGVVSITLVMEQFIGRFTRIDKNHNSAAGFWKGLMTAMLELGAVVGSAKAGFLADRFSRKYALAMGFAWFIVGGALQTGAVGFGMLVVGRTLGGIGIGTLSMIAPLYISEIAPPNVRGGLLVLEEWSIVFGIVVAYYITYGTRFIQSEWAWRLPFLIQLIPAIVLLVTVQFALPHSPRWLAMKGRDEECLEILAKLRQLPEDDDRVQAEWRAVRGEIIVQRVSQRERHPKHYDSTTGTPLVGALRIELDGWSDLFRRSCWRRTMVGVGLMFFQQFVGINALIYYSPTLFQTLGFGFEMQLNMSGVMNILQLVGVTPSFILLDRIGRRPLLLFGAALMTICHVIVAAMVGSFGSNWPAHQGPAWVGVAFIFIYMICFGLTWGPAPWAMPAEIFSSTLRAKGVAASTMSNWFNNFIIGLITPALIQHSASGAFVFFAVFSALAGVWTWIAVPETAHRSLEAMDAVWGDNVGQRDAQRTEEAIVRLENEDRAKRIPVDPK